MKSPALLRPCVMCLNGLHGIKYLGIGKTKARLPEENLVRPHSLRPKTKFITFDLSNSCRKVF